MNTLKQLALTSLFSIVIYQQLTPTENTSEKNIATIKLIEKTYKNKELKDQ